MRFDGAAGTTALGSMRSYDMKVPTPAVAHSAVVPLAKKPAYMTLGNDLSFTADFEMTDFNA